jgi:hypothetical protein
VTWILLSGASLVITGHLTLAASQAKNRTCPVAMSKTAPTNLVPVLTYCRKECPTVIKESTQVASRKTVGEGRLGTHTSALPAAQQPSWRPLLARILSSTLLLCANLTAATWPKSRLFAEMNRPGSVF